MWKIFIFLRHGFILKSRNLTFPNLLKNFWTSLTFKQKRKSKQNFVKKIWWITKYFGGSDPMNELMLYTGGGRGENWPAELVIILQSFCRKHFLRRLYSMHPKFNSYLIKIMIMVILFRFLSHEHAANMFFKFLEITLSRIRVIYCNPTCR